MHISTKPTPQTIPDAYKLRPQSFPGISFTLQHKTSSFTASLQGRHSSLSQAWETLKARTVPSMPHANTRPRAPLELKEVPEVENPRVPCNLSHTAENRRHQKNRAFLSSGATGHDQPPVGGGGDRARHLPPRPTPLTLLFPPTNSPFESPCDKDL